MGFSSLCPSFARKYHLGTECLGKVAMDYAQASVKKAKNVVFDVVDMTKDWGTDKEAVKFTEQAITSWYRTFSTAIDDLDCGLCSTIGSIFYHVYFGIADEYEELPETCQWTIDAFDDLIDDTFDSICPTMHLMKIPDMKPERKVLRSLPF